MRIYLLYTITAGFAAGSLGIAAGTILGPILLEMGLVPIVGTSSSGFMVIFTASSTTFQFLVMGQLQVLYVCVCVCERESVCVYTYTHTNMVRVYVISTASSTTFQFLVVGQLQVLYVCVCVCERERERERERECQFLVMLVMGQLQVGQNKTPTVKES